MGCRRRVSFWVPAAAGTHASDTRRAETWVPAFAGNSQVARSVKIGCRRRVLVSGSCGGRDPWLRRTVGRNMGPGLRELVGLIVRPAISVLGSCGGRNPCFRHSEGGNMGPGLPGLRRDLARYRFRYAGGGGMSS